MRVGAVREGSGLKSRSGHRRVRTFPIYQDADSCGHWYPDDEPRAVDAGWMSEDDYWAVHGPDMWGEVTLCFVGRPYWETWSWCPVDREWEDGEIERACIRLQARKAAGL